MITLFGDGHLSFDIKTSIQSNADHVTFSFKTRRSASILLYIGTMII